MPDTDSKWAPLARKSRDALALLGYHVGPQCLPDEAEPCGDTFGQHVAAHLAALNAVSDHHLKHLGAPKAMVGEIYRKTAADIRAGTGCDLG